MKQAQLVELQEDEDDIEDHWNEKWDERHTIFGIVFIEARAWREENSQSVGLKTG